MTKNNYFEMAQSLGCRASVLDGYHAYFEQHRDRLWATLNHFDLPALKASNILEIGPFYSYTPFLLKSVGNKLSVLEGDDPAAYPLKALYEAEGIDLLFCDLFERFGDAPSAIRQLPYRDNQFDAVLCWETMEHFNFNPVPFVKELWRILKPGGVAYITVPNLAKLDRRLKLLVGKSPATAIKSYVEAGMGKCYSFHWREYTLAEVKEMFSGSGFITRQAGFLHTFQNYSDGSRLRKFKRAFIKPLVALCPSFSSLCTVTVEKPL